MSVLQAKQVQGFSYYCPAAINQWCLLLRIWVSTTAPAICMIPECLLPVYARRE